MNKRIVLTALIGDGVNSTSAKLFVKWHEKSPEVWKELEKVALEAINTGIPKWGAKGIAEVVRWNLSMRKKEEFKLNNNYVSYYARVFVLKYPEHSGFFEFREVRGLKEAA